MGDLFDPGGPALTESERKRQLRAAAAKMPVIKGHAWTPGTGPKGETCKTCKHLYRNRQSKVYLKCLLIRARWTGGPGTDIRAGDPACLKWEKRSDDK